MLVARMRDAQTAYFKSRGGAHELRCAKDLERHVDKELRRLELGRSLFEDSEAETEKRLADIDGLRRGQGPSDTTCPRMGRGRESDVFINDDDGGSGL